MTAAEKRAATTRARREQREAAEAAAKNDVVRAIAVCRTIRDAADSTDADRLKAIELLAMYTADSRRPTV